MPADFDTGINGALVAPAGPNHYAFMIKTVEAPTEKKATLVGNGLDVSKAVDHCY